MGTTGRTGSYSTLQIKTKPIKSGIKDGWIVPHYSCQREHLMELVPCPRGPSNPIFWGWKPTRRVNRKGSSEHLMEWRGLFPTWVWNLEDAWKSAGDCTRLIMQFLEEKTKKIWRAGHTAWLWLSVGDHQQTSSWANWEIQKGVREAGFGAAMNLGQIL